MSEPTVSRKKKAPKEPRVSCRVSVPLKRRLDRIARANGVDVSDVVRMALNRALPAYEQAAKAA